MNNTILDRTDLQILSLLQKDATLSNKQLGLKLHKASHTIYNRIERLKEAGYIEGTLTIVNREKLGETLSSYTQIQLKDHSALSLNNFQQATMRFTEVMECYHMTGDFDFILKIVVANMQAYKEFVVNKLANLPDVGTVRSQFVIHQAKRELAYTIELAKE
uniref:Lrp/AsnC family transcriptional regulator n=1 Tax=Pedobacter schmidteae TaxID=2201271 RepID=UPI000EAF0D49|nr:Lrp/AsnC family transcriptional regulator [Pedobacter schmidteae]